MKTPRVLAFDTSGPHIAAAVWPSAVEPVYEEMRKGQAECLMPICHDLLAEAGLAPGDLEAVAVGVGPGNFTGTRIAVSAARGLSLGLGIPAIGVTGFELLHQGRMWSARVMLSLPAPQGRAYVQTFLDGHAQTKPSLTTPGVRDIALEQPNFLVAGYRAEQIASGYNAEFDADAWDSRHPEMTGTNLALIAADKLSEAGGAWSDRPAPLYIKAADAAPSRQSAPKIIE